MRILVPRIKLAKDSKGFTQHLVSETIRGQRMNAQHSKLSAGFTIAELLLASSVFTIVLLVSVTGFLQIGHLFYKGVSTTQTQSLSKDIVDDIASNVQLADVIQGELNSGGYKYYCVGNNRYTINKGFKVDFSQPRDNSPSKVDGTGGNFGILKDVLPGASACATPTSSKLASSTELLGNKMRLVNLDVSQVACAPADPVCTASNQNLYTVSITVAYGDDEVLDNPADPATITCKGSLSTQQFCAVDSVSTSVYKGYGR